MISKTARDQTLRDDTQHMEIRFIDGGKTSKHPSNPKYPDGMIIDVTRGATPSCTVSLPWPAPGCGMMTIECQLCGLRTGVTVAGRRDDPRVVVMPCEQARKLH